jgi:hypothetical protein
MTTTTEKLVYDLEQLLDLRNDLFTEQEKINEQLTLGYDKIVKLKKKINKRIIDSINTSEIIPWELLLDCDHYDNTLNKFANELLNKYGISTFGYNIDTNQIIIKICLHQNKPEQIDKLLKGLNIILPFIKLNDKGYKYIDLLESTLSEYGSYWLKIDDKFNLMTTVYNRDNLIYSSNSLEELIKYIQHNHYYK